MKRIVFVAALAISTPASACIYGTYLCNLERNNNLEGLYNDCMDRTNDPFSCGDQLDRDQDTEKRLEALEDNQ